MQVFTNIMSTAGEDGVVAPPCAAVCKAKDVDRCGPGLGKARGSVS
jgi:hypothetical protein